MIPLVSVIVRTYNSIGTVGRCFDSIFGQTLSANRLEVIVVDDGSTDGTKVFLEHYKDRATIFLRPHAGTIASANFGFKQAKGKYVMLVDSDDWIEAGALEALSSALEAKPGAGFAYCDIACLERGRRHVISLWRFNIFNTIACNVMFRRSVLESALVRGAVYDDSLPCYAEYDLLLRLMRVTNNAYVPSALYNYCRRGDSVTANKSLMASGMKRFVEKHGFCGSVI